MALRAPLLLPSLSHAAARRAAALRTVRVPAPLSAPAAPPAPLPSARPAPCAPAAGQLGRLAAAQRWRWPSAPFAACATAWARGPAPRAWRPVPAPAAPAASPHRTAASEADKGGAAVPAAPQRKHTRLAEDRERAELVRGLSPAAAYDRLAESGHITRDEHQRRAVQHLDRLFERLQSYEPPRGGWNPPVIATMVAKLKAWWKWRRAQNDPSSLLLKPPPPPSVVDESYRSLPDAPLGLYVHGDVGTGKTFLMDLFFDQCVHIERKRRVHFHAFMLDIHRRIHEWKKRRGADSDPIPPLARELAADAWLLCFDEFQVTDIADAMILHRLFFYLWCNGIVLVATSNRVPEDLYKGGLQRPQFLPFIESLKHRAEILNLDSGVDYRLRGTIQEQAYLWPLSEENKEASEEMFLTLTHHQQQKRNHTIAVQGRTFTVPVSVGGIAKFTFQDLCCKPHGAADYIALCEQFHTVFVTDIPEMSVAQKTEAKRLLVFIDAMYEHKCKLLCTAAAPPDRLFGQKPPDENDLNETLERQEREFLDALKLDHSNVDLFSGQEELFQFARAVSRMKEMQTAEYMATSKWVYSAQS